jgi:transcriptional regulator with XRE-family HTH domain
MKIILTAEIPGLCEKLESARWDARLTYLDIAEKAGVTQTTAHRVCRNKGGAYNLKTVLAIASALNVNALPDILEKVKEVLSNDDEPIN